MDEAELRQILAEGESDRVEFTVSTSDTTKFSEAVCAFANDLPEHRRPGHLVIGVEDDGRIAGLRLDDEMLQRLGGLRSDGNIQPLPVLTVERLRLAEGEVAIVTVQPSHLPPVRYRGRIHVRVGPRQSIASEAEERRLIERRTASARTFDAQPAVGTSLQDLATALFTLEYRPRAVDAVTIAENHRPLEQQLASLRLYDLRSDCPTHAGLLLFGLDPLGIMPGAYVQFVRYDGTSLAEDVRNEQELRGDLLTVLRRLDDLILASIEQMPVPASLLREKTWASYPRDAIRELVLNGVLHRDYASTAPLRLNWFSDRVEIQSPGGLYGEATRSNFPRQTSYRNPVIAEAMKTLGYINRYGRGIARAQEILARNESPPAEFVLDPHFVLATVRRRQ